MKKRSLHLSLLLLVLFFFITSGFMPESTVDTCCFSELSNTPNLIEPTYYFDLVVDDVRGLLYGSDVIGGRIHILSQSTLEVVDFIDIGTSPRGIDMSPDGSELAVALAGPLGEAGEVVFIDLDSLTVTGRVVPDTSPSNRNSPNDVVYGRPGRLYVGNTDHIHVIDTISKSVIENYAKFGIFSSNLVTTSDNSELYVASTPGSPNHIYWFDISTDSLLYKGSAPFGPVQVNTIVLNGDESQVFTSKGQAWSSDLETHLGNFGAPGIQVEYIPGKDWIVISYQSELYINDASNYLYPLLATYSLSSTAGAVRVNSTSTIIYVCTSYGVQAIELPDTITPEIPPVDPQPDLYYDMVVDDARGLIYGSNWNGDRDEIDVISLASLEVIASIDLGGYELIDPLGLDISPDGNYLAVELSGVNKIGIIDLNTLSFSGFLFPGENHSEAIFGRPGRLYTACGTESLINFCVYDTSSYLEVGRDETSLCKLDRLVITQDGNTLFVNRDFYSMSTIFRFDVTTDNPVKIASIPYSSVQAKTLAIDPLGSRVYAASGQIWTGDLSFQLGSFGNVGDQIEYIVSRDAIAVSNGSQITFYDGSDFSLIRRYPLSTEAGVARANGDETILYVNTDAGIEAIDLTAHYVSVLDGSPQVANFFMPFSLPLIVQVTDFWGTPDQGVEVSFTAPTVGASGTFADSGTYETLAITDSNGIAEAAVLTANDIYGFFSVEASAEGFALPTHFSLRINAPPEIEILSPQTQSVFDFAVPITLIGAADDIEDGDISSQITWRSNVDGLIGTGDSVVFSTLNPGIHMITAEIVDSHGASAQANIVIRVFENRPPVAILFNAEVPQGVVNQWVKFVALFGDKNGAADLLTLEIDMDAGLDNPNSLHVRFEVDSNELYLLGQDGSFWIGPCTPGDEAVLTNGNVEVNCKLTIPYYLDTQFLKLRVVGRWIQPITEPVQMVVWLWAADRYENNSGLKNAGTWTLISD